MTKTRGLFLASFLLVVMPALAAEPKAPSARLVHASGDVTIESKAGGRLAKSGAALAEGDSVTTAAGAVAVIELPDGSRLKLRSLSRVAVTLVARPGPLTA